MVCIASGLCEQCHSLVCSPTDVTAIPPPTHTHTPTTATLIYAYGGLNWLGFAGLSEQVGGSILWMPPIVSFSIVTGLCLDYDIFLLTRVLFERRSGLEMRYLNPVVLLLLLLLLLFFSRVVLCE